MPKIQDAFSTFSIELPSYQGSLITIKSNVSMEDIASSEKGETAIDQTLILAERMIVDWNFDDEQGNKLPIKKENIKKLPAFDLKVLFEKIAPYIEKKTLSETTK